MISVDLVGRIGNQMFQYAICRIVADKNNYDFHIPRKNNQDHISDIFNLDLGFDHFDPSYYYIENEEQYYDSNIFNIKDGTKIWGYFQTEKYFNDYDTKIKNWFKVDLDEKIKSIINSYPVDEYCYIHFRGTDYQEWNNGKFFLPKSYYDEAINKLSSINDKLKFLVITDDLKLAKSFFNLDIISNDIITDFKLLYFSKFCIIPNSTFSWWANWLSNKKITIAPNNWLNYNTPNLGFYPADIKTNKFLYI